jgi:hypothetical protein
MLSVPKHLSTITLAIVMLTSGLVISTAIQSATAQSSLGPITEISNAVDELRARLTGVESTNENNSARLAALEKENEKLQSNLKLLNLQSAALQSQIDLIGSDIGNLNETDTDIELQVTEMKVMLEGQLLELKLKLAQSEQQLTQKSDHIAPEDLQSLLVLIDQMIDQITALETRVSALEGGEGQDGHGDDDTGDDDSDNDSTNEEDNDSDGFTVAEGDCNDDDAGINPEETETANGIDDNCDGEVDEGTTPVLESLTIKTIDGSGSLTDTLQYAASAKYSDGSIIEVTGEATWEGDGAATPTEPGVFLCVGAGTGEISATYQEITETASFKCELL